MALKNVNIPLNIKDYPENSSSNISKVSYLSEWDSDNNVGLNTNGLLIIGKNNSAGWTTNSLIIGNNNSSSSTLNANINSNYIMVGNNLLTNSLPEHDNTIQNGIILGQYNNPIANPKLIIGNGTAEEERSNIVEVTTDSINLTPANNTALNITGTGVNITGATTITGDAAVNGLLTIGDEDNGTTTIDMNEITTSRLNTNLIKANIGTSISIESTVNLNNNTISGGATLNGTYTFDSVNGLKIGTSTINSANTNNIITLPRSTGTLALTDTIYYKSFTILWDLRTQSNNVEVSINTWDNSSNGFDTGYNFLGVVSGSFISDSDYSNFDNYVFNDNAPLPVCGSIQMYNPEGTYYPGQSYNLYYAYTTAEEQERYLIIYGGAYYGESSTGYVWHNIRLRFLASDVSIYNREIEIG